MAGVKLEVASEAPRRSLEVRLWGRAVAGPNGCALWTGAVTKHGYGKFRHKGVDTTPHRVAYEAKIGPVPEGLQLDHRCHGDDISCPGGSSCRHRRCMNPYHLEAVTPKENTHRATHSPSGINSRRTECPQGHPYDEDNTRVRNSSERACRTCERERHIRRLSAPERPPVWDSCRKGHALTEDNIYRQGAVLTCRTCRRASQARYRARKRAQLAGGAR